MMDNSPFHSRGAVPSASPVKTTSVKAQESLEVVSTPEIQKWMTNIELHLNEVCSIAADGKLNTEQKLKISNLCRKIGSGTSQMAVLYQSLKQKAVHAYNTIDAMQEKRDLSEHLSELKKTIQESSNTGNVSFAEMVKNGPNSYVRPNNVSSVVIYPEDKSKSSNETKILVQKIIRPDDIKLQVRGLRRTKDGGVIISTETKQDAEKLKRAVQASTSGLTADEPNKRKPRIVVIGVPTNLTENEVFRYIFQQNIADKVPTVTMETFLTLIKLSHKSGKKDASTCNYVIEVPAHIRKALISQTRLFVNWSSCPVRDFTLVTRCYNCHQYGHAAKSCRDAQPICGHCGEAGHTMSNCAKKSDATKCATCLRFKKPSNHKTGDTECPARKLAENRYINSIDYEGT